MYFFLFFWEMAGKFGLRGLDKRLTLVTRKLFNKIRIYIIHIKLSFVNYEFRYFVKIMSIQIASIQIFVLTWEYYSDVSQFSETH